MEENLEHLKNLHKEFEKNPGSTLLYYQIANLSEKLGLKLKIPVSIDALNGTFSYEPDEMLLKKGLYIGLTEKDFKDEDIIKKMYTKI